MSRTVYVCPTCRHEARALRGAVEHEHANRHHGEAELRKRPAPLPTRIAKRLEAMLARELAGWGTR